LRTNCISFGKDKFQIHIKIQALKTYLILILVRPKQKIKAKKMIVLKYTINVFILSLNESKNIRETYND